MEDLRLQPYFNLRFDLSIEQDCLVGTSGGYTYLVPGRHVTRVALMSKIDLVSKNLLANCFHNFSKKDLKYPASRVASS